MTTIRDIEVVKLVEEHGPPKLKYLEAEYARLLAALLATADEIARVKLLCDIQAGMQRGEV